MKNSFTEKYYSKPLIEKPEDRAWLGNILSTIVNKASRTIGESYLKLLVKSLSTALQAKLAFISSCMDYPTTRVKTEAVWIGDDFGKNFEYDLVGTPCQYVIRDQEPQFYPRNLEKTFPKEKGYESYQAVPLFSADNLLIGHMGILDEKVIPLKEHFRREVILKLFSHRAEAELERIKIENEKTLLLEKVKRQKEYLYKANKKLTKLNEEKNNLIDIVAHDLKSPLNQIKGMMKLIELSGNELSAEQLNYLKMTMELITRSSKMINKVLDVSTIESGKINLTPETINIVDLTSQVLQNHQQAANNKAIVLSMETDEKAIYAMLDRNYIIQILDNLISNAIKFSNYKTQVTIRLFGKSGRVFIEIEDEGPGISKKDQEIIFEKFTRSSAKPTGNETSTGLGLAIVKKYTKAMNGKINLKSDEGIGTKFTLSFSQVAAS